MPTGFDVPSGGRLPEKLLNVVPRLLAYLKACRGSQTITPDSPATGARLIEVMAKAGIKVSGADVRAMVNHLRLDNQPIGSTSTGYFYALTEEELATTIQHLSDRENAVRRARRGLEKAFIPPTLFQHPNDR